MSDPVLAAALAWHAAGACVLPVRTDGTKAPYVGSWTEFYGEGRRERPGVDQLHRWFGHGRPGGSTLGLGILTGSASVMRTSSGEAAPIEMLEFEGRAMHRLDEVEQLARDSGLGDLWDRVTRDGYTEGTPSGGVHLIYAVAVPPGTSAVGTVAGNRKLAHRPTTPDELAADPKTKRLALAETRGEGGFVVIAPTGTGDSASCHDSGRPWVVYTGGPNAIPLVTPEERDALHVLASTLDEMPEPEPARPARPISQPAAGPGEVSPLDDYEARTDWADILEPEGWALVRQFSSGMRYWRRPGKEGGQDVSATTGRDPARDRLYVFSTSTEFEAERPYTKPGAYAVLHHGGDHSAAAGALRKAGYGSPRDRPAPPVAPVPPPAPAGGTDGNLATVHQLPAPGAGSAVPDGPLGAGGTVSTLHHTDDFNALRLVATHGSEIRRVLDMGRWHRWDGVRWRPDADEAAVRELAKGLARRLPQGDKDDRLFKRNSLSAAGLSSAIRVAASDPRVSVLAEQLDAHPYLLNTPDGVLDLRTGELAPHDADLLLTRATAHGVHTGAPCPRWEAFLDETFDGDAEMIGYLQRLAGLMLIGDVREHILPVLYGTGANGKGVTLLVFQALLGAHESGGYALSAPDGFLTVGPAPSHPTEVARLRGARLVIASEQTSGRRFDEARVKRLTGGDMLTGRFMRGDFFDFRPSHLIVVATNHLPEVREGGPSFWRRARLIPFAHVVPEDRRDPELHNRLVEAEGPAILGWMAAGAASVIAGGLADPAQVKAATEEYRISEDSLASFIRDECFTGPAWHCKISDFTHRYAAHCRDMGVEPPTAKSVTMRLTSEFGVESTRMPDRTRARIYRGIGLQDVPDATDGDR